ncbi:PP2C family serine/threonine-protein phosphatase [Catenulispora rubra]|uniref:PP2C family serine/threonine-protein phosphatase n=1 Tax=Catenulispora rubra TaxID=280293 RepID=UPI00189239D5|nr:PP2C family serine/threonine-protein phosphatase [Catenulispora rubra]
MTTKYVPRVGTAQRGGTRPWCCDGSFVYRYEPDEVTAACVTDAPGSSEKIGHTARLLAEVAARMAARRSVFSGLTAAGELVAFPQTDDDARSDAVAVVAVMWDAGASIGWVGDARGWSWDGQTLTQVTTDQTMAAWLAARGSEHTGLEISADLMDFGNAFMRVSLATASAAAIREARVDADLTVILTSDGVHDALGPERMTEIARTHSDDPQALAEALAAAPDIDEDGYRDDATVVVLAPPTATTKEEG